MTIACHNFFSFRSYHFVMNRSSLKMSFSVCWLLIFLVSCLHPVVCDEGWIDPYDMENFDPSSNSMKNKKKEEFKTDPPVPDSKQNTHNSKEKKETLTITNSPVESKKNNTDKGGNLPTCTQDSSPCPALFRQYVQILLYHIKGKVSAGSEELNLRVSITEAEVKFLETYSESSLKDVRHVHEILSSMIKLAMDVQHGDPTVNKLWIEEFIGVPLEKAMMLASLALVVGLIFVAANTLNFSWRRLTIKLIFFLFVISVFWQWWELYKKEEAKQHLEIMKEMPEGCRKREKEEFFVKTMIVSLMSSFTFRSDECLQYYEHLLIDPFWKVTPTQALAKTVVRFFLSPAREVGEAISDLMTGLLKDLPVQLWPVVLSAAFIFSFLFLFMFFQYRISLPFGVIAIEPGQRTDNSRLLQEIHDQKEQIKCLEEEKRTYRQEITPASNLSPKKTDSKFPRIMSTGVEDVPVSSERKEIKCLEEEKRTYRKEITPALKHAEEQLKKQVLPEVVGEQKSNSVSSEKEEEKLTADQSESTEDVEEQKSNSVSS